jgi:hypothetical protein
LPSFWRCARRAARLSSVIQTAASAIDCSRVCASMRASVSAIERRLGVRVGLARERRPALGAARDDLLEVEPGQELVDHAEPHRLARRDRSPRRA